MNDRMIVEQPVNGIILSAMESYRSPDDALGMQIPKIETEFSDTGTTKWCGPSTCLFKAVFKIGQDF